MLRQIFESLDGWIAEQNQAALDEGLPALRKCEFRIVGQSALLEAKLDINIAATADVDVLNDAEHSVLAKLNQLLMRIGLEYDQLSSEIWMPQESKYVALFRGAWLTASRAKPEYIMLSKAKMALQKNRLLLQEYIASGPPDTFFDLCLRYGVDMDRIVKGTK